MSAFEDFQRAATRFKDGEKEKRPAVLVLDNVNVIARHDPALPWKLQELAKDAAVHGLYKVFVCSDCPARNTVEN
jgi:hypothetical protein